MKKIAARMMALLLFIAIILSTSVSAKTSQLASADESWLAGAETVEETAETSGLIGVRYHTHVQNIGWGTKWAANGGRAGSEGLGLRLEGIEIELTGDVPEGAAIKYRTHVQNIGWEDSWAFDGSTSGTEGQSLRLEGIQIELVNLPSFSVEYQTHVENIGWESTWAKDGEIAGTQGQGLRLEGIKIRLIKNGPSIEIDLTEKSEITPSGGVVDLADGSKVVVPSGALSENSTLDFSRLVEKGGSDSFYQLDGLPSFWLAPMTVTLPLDQIPDNPDEIYIAIYHDTTYRPSSNQIGTNRQLLKAEVNGKMATIQLPSLNPDIIPILSADENLETDAVLTQVFLHPESAGIHTETIDHFKLTVPTRVQRANPALITEIENALRETSTFVQDTSGVNLSYAGGRNPIPVDIFDFNTLIERYLGSRSPAAWGYLEISGVSRSSQIANAFISINSNKFNDANAAQQIRATVAHELFHYYQQLYLPNDGRAHNLFQEASSVWMEFQMMKKYPGFWPDVVNPENVAWFPKNGLLRDYDTECHNQDGHAYAASLFLQYMSEKNGNKAVGDLWRSVKTHDELFKALADGFNDPNWYTKWPDFIKKLYSGDYTKAMPDTTWSIHNHGMINPASSYRVDDPYTQTKDQFTSNVYSLSAESHQILMRYNTKGFDAGAKAQLKITNQNSDIMTAFLYRKKADGSVEYIATIDSETPYILNGLEKDGKQALSLVTATKWQPTAVGINDTKKIVIDVEIIFDHAPHDDYDCGWMPDYSKLVKQIDNTSPSIHSYSHYNYDGILHGLTRFYFDEKMTIPWIAEPYYEGELHGIVTRWYENGNMEKRIEYQHGKNHGSYKTWYENGNQTEDYHYSNGLRNGPYTNWYESGAKRSAGIYANGKENGLFTSWHENGVKSAEGNYVNDKRSGNWTWWYSDGTISDSGFF